MQRKEQVIGPMIGHTTATSARIWLRADLIMRQSDYQTTGKLYYHEAFIEEKIFNFLSDNNDYIALIEFGKGESKLKPDTKYHYTIETQKLSDKSIHFSMDGYFKTFSNRLDKEVEFITGSCRHLYAKNGGDEAQEFMQEFKGDIVYGDQAFKTIEKLIHTKNDFHPQFMLMTGDQVYADHEEGSFHSTNPSKSFADYIDNYHRAYPQKHFASLAKIMPFYMIMDDHEIKNDWMMDKIYPFYDKEAKENLIHYKNGLQAYALYQVALSSVIENTDELDSELKKINTIGYEKELSQVEQPYRESTKGLYYTFEQGVGKFFCMDVRTERYMHKKKAQIIGEYQQQALYDWLEEHKEDEKVKFIVTSVPIFPDTKALFGAPEDKWGGYSEQRKEILDFIRENEIKKVIFISGDVHVSLSAKLQFEGEDIGVYSIVSSAFTWPVPGLQRWNFDWKPLADSSKLKGAFWKNEFQKKRRPDNSCRGNYQAIQLTHWKWFGSDHQKHNFCHIRTDGKQLFISYYRSEKGELVEELEPIEL